MASTRKVGEFMSDTMELFAEGLFKGLAPDETEAFLRQCQKKTYPDGANLFMEQTDATKLYLILNGGIDLHFEMPKHENAYTKIASRKQGAAVGWSAIVPPTGIGLTVNFAIPENSVSQLPFCTKALYHLLVFAFSICNGLAVFSIVVHGSPPVSEYSQRTILPVEPVKAKVVLSP